MRVSVHTFNGDSFAVHQSGEAYALSATVNATAVHGEAMVSSFVGVEASIYLTVPAIKALAVAAGLIPREATDAE